MARVLVVEDERKVHRGLRELLGQEGYEVVIPVVMPVDPVARP